MTFEQAFENISIKQRMNYLVASATMAVMGASVFVFFALSGMEKASEQLFVLMDSILEESK